MCMQSRDNIIYLKKTKHSDIIDMEVATHFESKLEFRVFLESPFAAVERSLELPTAYCPRAFSLQLQDVALIDVVVDFVPAAVASDRMETVLATIITNIEIKLTNYRLFCVCFFFHFIKLC